MEPTAISNIANAIASVANEGVPVRVEIASSSIINLALAGAVLIGLWYLGKWITNK